MVTADCYLHVQCVFRVYWAIPHGPVGLDPGEERRLQPLFDLDLVCVGLLPSLALSGVRIVEVGGLPNASDEGLGGEARCVHRP